MLRVAQWSLGLVGRHALEAIIDAPDMELVGVCSTNAKYVGKDAHEVCGRDTRSGITVSADPASIIAMRPDCIVYAAAAEYRPKDAVADIVSILKAGINVVTSSMMDAYHPGSLDVRASGPIQAACIEGNSTFLATGMDPGFTSDAMPLAAIQLCRSIDVIRSQELFTYGYHHNPSWAIPYGFGQPPEAPAPILDPGIPTKFWVCTVHTMAEILGVKVERTVETVERWVADEDFDVPLGHVAKGTVSAIRFEVAGIVDGEPRLIAEHVTRMRPDQAPHWPKPPAEFDGVHRIEIQGDPPLTMDVNFTAQDGVEHNDAALNATAARVVCAIGPVVAAAPGMTTPSALPLAYGRNILSRSR